MIDWSTLLPLAAALLATGILAGLLAGLLGVGGGIVIVPVLYYIFGALGVDEAALMHLAVGTSLATIVPTSMASARTHYRKGGIDIALFRSWGPWIAVGVVAGTVIGGNIAGEALTAVFAVIALLVALNMAVGRTAALGSRLPATPWKQSIAGAIGCFSVMMGIGGGTLTVPILSAFAYPIRKAVGTASIIGLVIAVPGAIGYLVFGLGTADLPPGTIGFVNLIAFAAIVPMTVLCAPIGARIAHAINPGVLKRVFALFLFITSVKMFADIL